MSLQNLHTHRYAHKGFSLIEAALVLGVVALVIGGLWIAASSVQQARKINEISKDILFIVQGVRSLIPFENYPSTNLTSNGINIAAHNAGLYPKNYTLNAGAAYNPYGNRTDIYLACWGSTYPSASCPIMGVLIYLNNKAECNQLIRKVGANYRDDKNFRYAQVISPTNSNVASYYPPLAGQTIDCTNDVMGIYFWFAPN